jgi:hypothetical protein
MNVQPIVGLVTSKVNTFNLESYLKQGFTGIYLQIKPHYDGVCFLDYDTEEERQMLTAKSMYSEYERLINMGFKHVLVECNWGLGPIDGNYFYEKIMYIFKDAKDVSFLIDEPYETVREKLKHSLEEFESYLFSLKSYFVHITSRNPDELIITSTKRNHLIVPGIRVLSSYFGQHHYWRISIPLVFIYGQIKIDGGLRYEAYSDLTKEYKTKLIYLYQNDPTKWDWSMTYTWINSILDFLGLYDIIECYLKKRFIEYFKYTITTIKVK